MVATNTFGSVVKTADYGGMEMKLERYVLLDNTMIFDRNVIKEEDFIFRILKRIENDDTENLCRQLKKTSNNILDLVEVGDLVEYVRYGDKETVLKQYDKYTDNILQYDNISAIYKKQPNGDYKRYEVER